MFGKKVWFLFSFKGRINRYSYWLFSAWVFTALVLIQGLTGEFTLNREEWSNQFWIALLILIWPVSAVQAKRWHDTDLSAWWILINFVPILGGICALIANGFFISSEGDNRYGPNPTANNNE